MDSDEIKSLAEQAFSGIPNTGTRLLKEAAKFADNPEEADIELVRYLLTAARRYNENDFKINKAREAFGTQKSVNTASEKVLNDHHKVRILYEQYIEDGLKTTKAKQKVAEELDFQLKSVERMLNRTRTLSPSVDASADSLFEADDDSPHAVKDAIENREDAPDALADSFQEMILAALEGDAAKGKQLLTMAADFADDAQGVLHSALALHVCECIRRFRDSDYKNTRAQDAFLITQRTGGSRARYDRVVALALYRNALQPESTERKMNKTQLLGALAALFNVEPETIRKLEALARDNVEFAMQVAAAQKSQKVVNLLKKI